MKITAPGTYDVGALHAGESLEIAASGVRLMGLTRTQNTAGTGILIGQGVKDFYAARLEVLGYNLSGGDGFGTSGLLLNHAHSGWVDSVLVRATNDKTYSIFGWADKASELVDWSFGAVEVYGGWDCFGAGAEDNPEGGYKKLRIAQFRGHGWADDGLSIEGKNTDVQVDSYYLDGEGRGLMGLGLAPSGGQVRFGRGEIRGVTSGLAKLGDGGSGDVYLNGGIGRSAYDGFKQTNSGLGTRYHVSDWDIELTDATRYLWELTSRLPAGSVVDRNVYRGSTKFKHAGSVIAVPQWQALGFDRNSTFGGGSVPPPAVTTQESFRRRTRKLMSNGKWSQPVVEPWGDWS